MSEYRIDMQRIFERLDGYISAGDFDGAEKFLNTWLEDCRACGNTRAELAIENELTGFMRKQQREKEAFEHAERAMELVDIMQIGNTPEGATTILNYGTVCEAFGLYDKACDLFSHARKVYEADFYDGDPRYAYLYNNYAYAAEMSGMHELATELKFCLYKQNLLNWNKVMNLTAITDSHEIDTLHFQDSTALLDFADFKNKSVIDVGTGAGFPGLPLKIAEDSIDLTLLDSLDKRVKFLQDTVDKLRIENVICIHARAEEIPGAMRQAYDIAVSRAVARLKILAELCIPYVKVGGLFIAMKGPEFDEELEEAKPIIKALGGKTEKCVKYTIPGTDVTHSAILVRKIADTDKKIYPRKWSKISKA